MPPAAAAPAIVLLCCSSCWGAEGGRRAKVGDMVPGELVLLLLPFLLMRSKRASCSCCSVASDGCGIGLLPGMGMAAGAGMLVLLLLKVFGGAMLLTSGAQLWMMGDAAAAVCAAAIEAG